MTGKVLPLVALPLALLLGCSSVPKADAMTARSPDPGRRHPGSVAVHVAGGGGSSYRISDEAFRGAVVASLLDAGIFSGAVEIGGADYRLDAILGDLRQQPGGFNMTTEMTVLWSLSRTDTAETVWQELVQSSYTATFGSSLIAVNRARKSTEGAARENIAEALRRLAAADP